MSEFTCRCFGAPQSRPSSPLTRFGCPRNGTPEMCQDHGSVPHVYQEWAARLAKPTCRVHGIPLVRED